jgi:pSer/pThr/pTyr-binding forkhead associated (FHA) protein
MDTKKLVIKSRTGLPAVTVKVEQGTAAGKEFQFEQPFSIGRDATCQIALDDIAVSRVHAEVYFETNNWWIRDLKSTNGTFKDGAKITRSKLTGKTKITLGVGGPLLSIEVEGGETPGDQAETKSLSVTAYVQRYFASSGTEKVGAHTEMVRQAFQQVQKKQSRKYVKIIVIVGILFVGAATYAVYKHYQVAKQEALAENIFFELKSLELKYTAVERQIATSGDASLRTRISDYFAKRKELTAMYDRTLGELGIYNDKMNEQERTIYRVARIFGECEVSMPDGFVEEVQNYIYLWKSSSRLNTAMQRAQEKGYAPRIAASMITHNMPPQFFYLALQESEFDSTICGPATRFGIAKGMWQFVPGTAVEYGLKTGPLVHLARQDPLDERQNVEKSSDAAAQYIRDIYSTEAQASGLLVIASYNWGHNVVRGLIKKMPENPRQRNFWKFLATYKAQIPKQTYDYVFYIFSAAVIGENPKLFGFQFPRPFESEGQYPAQAGDAPAAGNDK